MTSACASRTSFRYYGCGCGALPWRGDVDGLWSTLDSGRASGDASGPPAPRRLRVSYLIPHHNVTGGMKMIMKQVGAAAVRARVCACVQRVWSSGVALVTPAPNVFFKPPLCALRWVHVCRSSCCAPVATMWRLCFEHPLERLCLQCRFFRRGCVSGSRPCHSVRPDDPPLGRQHAFACSVCFWCCTCVSHMHPTRGLLPRLCPPPPTRTPLPACVLNHVACL